MHRGARYVVVTASLVSSDSGWVFEQDGSGCSFVNFPSERNVEIQRENLNFGEEGWGREMQLLFGASAGNVKGKRSSLI